MTQLSFLVSTNVCLNEYYNLVFNMCSNDNDSLNSCLRMDFSRTYISDKPYFVRGKGCSFNGPYSRLHFSICVLTFLASLLFFFEWVTCFSCCSSAPLMRPGPQTWQAAHKHIDHGVTQGPPVTPIPAYVR